ncbi:MAG: asparaginase [Candidatus Saccharimonadales bacterium]
MKNIAVLGFGGTIGMVPDDSGTLYPAKNIEELFSYVPQLESLANLQLTQLENRDSTNITPNHWSSLAKKIWSIQDDVDAVIVTHGTDTLAYTSSAVSIVLGRNLKIPVIFTGSQLPISEPGNDARFNLENSVKVALQAIAEDIVEVMNVFSARVLRANRSVKISESKFDAFDSPAFPYLAQITAAGIFFNPVAFKNAGTETEKPSFVFNREIFAFDVVPGMDPVLLRSVIRSKKCKAILIKSLGAGNVPSEGPYSLISFIEECTKNNIPVLISTKFVGGKTIADMYEPGMKALNAGAIPTGDMTDVTAQVKLMWLLAKGHSTIDDLKNEVLRNYVGEVS